MGESGGARATTRRSARLRIMVPLDESDILPELGLGPEDML